MLSFFVYILKCSDGSYYVGHTDDMDRRLAQHQSGELGGYTSLRRPVTLVYVAEFPEREQAKEFEHRVKGWSRKKKDALIAGDWSAVSAWAKRPSRQPRE